MLELKIEQRVIKCLAKFNKTAAESRRMLSEVYVDECLSRTRVFEWHKRFCSGREDVENDGSPRLSCHVGHVALFLILTCWRQYCRTRTNKNVSKYKINTPNSLKLILCWGMCVCWWYFNNRRIDIANGLGIIKQVSSFLCHTSYVCMSRVVRGLKLFVIILCFSRVRYLSSA